MKTRRPTDHLAVDRLERTFAGDVIRTSDARYDDARRVWNAMIDRRPALIVRPMSPDDVATALRFGRDSGLGIAVRSGGHSVAGYSTCDDGLVIDLGRMRGVSVDRGRRIARVNGGAFLSELDRAAQEHGLVCPVGIVGHTGVAGLTLGGGVGRLQRKFGLTIDSLRMVELVTADGRRVRAGRDENEELFWGIRGAGANFGIVTAFEFDLHPLEPMLRRGLWIYPMDRLQEVWGLFDAIVSAASNDLAATFSLGLAIPASDFDPSIAGRPIVAVSVSHVGDDGAAARDIRPLLEAAPAVMGGALDELTYLDMQGSNDETFAWGLRVFTKGGFTNGLKPATLDALAAHLGDAIGENGVAVLAQGGAMADLDEGVAAFTGRSARYHTQCESYWTDPSEDEAHVAWTRRGMDILDADAALGRYVNTLTDTDPALGRSVYGDEKLARLVAIKRAWDPDNVFRLNQNIDPSPQRVPR
jgi:FAD/FMN-containing dehydrogenase